MLLDIWTKDGASTASLGSLFSLTEYSYLKQLILYFRFSSLPPVSWALLKRANLLPYEEFIHIGKIPPTLLFAKLNCVRIFNLLHIHIRSSSPLITFRAFCRTHPSLSSLSCATHAWDYMFFVTVLVLQYCWICVSFT